MSYRIKIDPKSRKAARFISLLQKKIQNALAESGKTQQEVAEILGVDRSVINRRLKGGANLTARSIAEFAYAFDKDISFDFVGRIQPEHSNSAVATDNVIEIQKISRNVPIGTVNPSMRYSFEGAAS